jgi:hypothetical protein
MTEQNKIMVVSPSGKEFAYNRMNVKYKYKKEYDPFYKIFAIQKFARPGTLLGVSSVTETRYTRNAGSTIFDVFDIFFMGNPEDVDSEKALFSSYQYDVLVPVAGMRNLIPDAMHPEIGNYCLHLSKNKGGNFTDIKFSMPYNHKVKVSDSYHIREVYYKLGRPSRGGGSVVNTSTVEAIYFNQKKLEDAIREKGITLDFSLDNLKL